MPGTRTLMPLGSIEPAFRVLDVQRDATEIDRIGRQHGDVLLGVKLGHDLAHNATGAIDRARLIPVAGEIGKELICMRRSAAVAAGCVAMSIAPTLMRSCTVV
jgi:hypothetical protein